MDNATRIDKFIASKVENISRSKIQQVIEAGGVFVNGIPVSDSGHKAKIGDIINFNSELCSNDRPDLEPDSSVSFDVLYEDEELLVINKPAGVVVHAGAGNRKHTLVNGLIYHCNLSRGSDDSRPGIVHRIDKDTSGILVVAKNDYVHAALAEQFALHSITRKYICFCYGVFNLRNNKIETMIARDRSNRLKMAVSENAGKRAVTIYRTLQTYGSFASKLECELKTGRTHQIRVHLSSLGHSLIGDSLYKFKTYSLPKNVAEKIISFTRQALHAYYIEFIHPITGKAMAFKNDLPEDMKILEKALFEGSTF